MSELSDKDLLSALGVEAEPEDSNPVGTREARIIAGFEDILHFYSTHQRAPLHGEDRDIFERMLAIRLDRIKASGDCIAILASSDIYGLLKDATIPIEMDSSAEMDDDSLLAELGVGSLKDLDIAKLKNVRSREEARAAEEYAKRTPCPDFDKFKLFFEQIQSDLKSGLVESHEFKKNNSIEKGDLFILAGQKALIAEVGEEFVTEYDMRNRRLRVVYDNGTESEILKLSFSRALYKDPSARRLIDTREIGPLFSSVSDANDSSSGTVYVLRSKSDHPFISKSRDVIHKIGVTSNKVVTRIANAELDPTFLMAEVDVIATYELSNINRSKLESLIHRFFASTRLEIEVKDRFGNPVVPKEWFLVPLFIIDEAIDRIKNGTIVNCRYDAVLGRIVEIASKRKE